MNKTKYIPLVIRIDIDIDDYENMSEEQLKEYAEEQVNDGNYEIEKGLTDMMLRYKVFNN